MCAALTTTPPNLPVQNTQWDNTMLDEQTLQKMRDMKMNAMAEAFDELQQEAPSNQRSFAEKVGHMIDREWMSREDRRLTRLIRAAKLNHDATLDDVWTTQGRGVTKTVVRDLSACRWVANNNNVICLGKTGCGKSYFAAAPAQAACRHGFRSLYARARDCSKNSQSPALMEHTLACSLGSRSCKFSSSTTCSSRRSKMPNDATCLRSLKTATTDHRS